MIASVRGTVLSATDTTAIVEVGGVGLEISVTPAHARGLRVGSEATMRTALIVREDDLSLYGFADAEGRAVFDLLRGVSGVGPKSAMGVLAAMEPHEIAAAVITEDDAAFRRVSGIGQKTAKLIIVSLAGKMRAYESAGQATAVAKTGAGDTVLAGLVGLGWSERIATQVLDNLAAEADGEPLEAAALLRLALARLGTAQFSGSSPR